MRPAAPDHKTVYVRFHRRVDELLETFSKQTDFARVLMSSSRRMRRTGSTAIITAQLTPQIADVIIALGRMGPHTSLMLITPGAPDERQEKLLYLLRASGVETATVRA